MNGHCLCGAVSFTSPDTKEIGACHCGFCRRWGGGPMLAVHCGPDVAFTGEDQIAVYASSDWAQRAFCKRCGTHLYYKLLATGEYFVPAGQPDLHRQQARVLFLRGTDADAHGTAGDRAVCAAQRLKPF
jgi:hypothetical protein